MTNRSYILGIDVGGTSIKLGLFALNGVTLERDAAWESNPVTQLGVSAHTRQVAELISQAVDAARTLGGEIKAIGIASPGRFTANGIIKPGTSPNMGLTVSEFDHVNLKHEYDHAIAQYYPTLATIPLTVKNDGDAMLAGIIKSIEEEQAGENLKIEHLRGKTVALMGLGTGLGHAIVKMHSQGSQFEFVTDGHASKLRIPVDAEDLVIYQQAAVRLMHKNRAITGESKSELIELADGTVRAEDLYRAPMMVELCNVSHGKDIDVETNPQHRHIIQMMGKYLARTMAIIRSGESEDVEPANGWSMADKQAAAQTSIYLFGGGVGRSPKGKILINYALEELKRVGITDIEMLQITQEGVATHAAAVLGLNLLECASAA